MSKTTMKQFRLDDETIKMIMAIKRFMDDVYLVQAEELNMPAIKATQTDSVKYAVKHTYQTLKEEGYDL